MPPISVDVIGESDIGLVRERNEDVFVVMELGTGATREGGPHRLEAGHRGLLFSVFDGMGGAAAGDRASRLAADVFSQDLVRAAPRTRKELGEAMRRAVLGANRQVRKAGLEDPALYGMGTTLTAAGLIDGVLVLMHVGDSRAYLLRGGVFQQLTEDQSLIQELVASGQIRREDASAYEHNNVILQALGVTEDLVPFGAEIALRPGDLLLLCTDGLTSMVPQDELQEVLVSKGADLAATATALTGLARVHGGHDNITLVLARFDGEGLETQRASTGIEVRPLGTGVPWARRAGLSPLALVVLAVILMLTIAGVILLIGMD